MTSKKHLQFETVLNSLRIEREDLSEKKMKNIFCLEKIHSGRSDQADSLAKWLFNLTSEPSIKEKDHICWVCKQNFLRMKFAIEKILEIEKNE